MDCCMYDRFEECFEDCDGCPVAVPKADPDEMLDYYMDEYDYIFENE